MITADPTAPESRTFEADVAQLLQLMVHSVYSDRDVFLRELISNAADACERLRFEAIANPALLGDDPKPRITLLIDAESRRLTVEDNGIGMSRDEMAEALGTIARSGTKAFMGRIATAPGAEGAQLIGQFGIGFYSAFMVADRVEVVSRRARSDEVALWSSDGQGSFDLSHRQHRGTRARHTGDPAPEGGCHLLHRALHAGAHRQGPVRPCPGADRPRRETRRRAAGDRRWCRALGEAAHRDHG